MFLTQHTLWQIDVEHADVQAGLKTTELRDLVCVLTQWSKAQQ